MTSTPQVHQLRNPNFVPVQGNVPSERSHGTVGDRQKRQRTDGDTASDNIQDLLGDMNMTQVTSRNLDVHQGYPHTTTGIPYSIAGKARVINQTVGEYLAKFVDPIKTILSTNIHEEEKIMVVRKYVVGGRAMVTPEHAPARTVAIQEDVREVHLTRFGGDVEMNLNLFLRKADAKEELDMKIGAQRRELERTLVDMGYDMLMTQGTDLVDAVIRSSPLYSTHAKTQDRVVTAAADRINVQSVFGAMSKHAYPVQNLLSAARYASAYTTANEKGSVLILPHGVPDILRYTRRENMVYEIAGPALMSKTNGQKINMQFEDGYVDPSTSVKIVIHRQLPNFDQGTAHPDVSMGGLTSEAAFATFHRMPKAATQHEIVDLENGTWRIVKGKGNFHKSCASEAAAQFESAMPTLESLNEITSNSWFDMSHFTPDADGHTGYDLAEVPLNADDYIRSLIDRNPDLKNRTASSFAKPIACDIVVIRAEQDQLWTSFAHLTHALANHPEEATNFYNRVTHAQRKRMLDAHTPSANLAVFVVIVKQAIEELDGVDPSAHKLREPEHTAWHNVYVTYCAYRLLHAAIALAGSGSRGIDLKNDTHSYKNVPPKSDGKYHIPKHTFKQGYAAMMHFVHQYAPTQHVDASGNKIDMDVSKTVRAEKNMMEKFLLEDGANEFARIRASNGTSEQIDDKAGVLITSLNNDLFASSGTRGGAASANVTVRSMFGTALWQEGTFYNQKEFASISTSASRKVVVATAEKMVRAMQEFVKDTDQFEELIIRRRINAMMSSAILAAPGESTGSLLVGYPFTSVSTSSQEMVKIQMRVYLGCVLRSPESVIVLRDVYFEGLKDGYKFSEDAVDTQNNDLVRCWLPTRYLDENRASISYADFGQAFEKHGATDTSAETVLAGVLLVGAGLLESTFSDREHDDDNRTPQKVYCGATKTTAGNGVTLTKNTGHMGSLDHPDHTARLWGSFVYDRTPEP